MSGIKRWLVPGGQSTHLLMDGGTLSVPDEERREFEQEYIKDLNLGIKLYVVEKRTDNFKFFVDLDYRADDKLGDTELLDICGTIHRAIGSPGRCCIARARPRPEKGRIKSGVHIVWPDYVVDRSQALANRTKILMCFEGPEWSDFIDSSVYSGSGLRMVWSHKKPAGDPYLPWRTLSGTELPKEPAIDILRLFSIRTTEVPKRTFEDPVFESSVPIESFIQRNIVGQDKAHVKKVARLEDGAGWYVQTDSKFCEKVQGEHKSNHVWFVIRNGRICQKCFNEECKEHVGQEYILPPSIVDEIVTVGSPPSCSLLDLFPEGPRGPFPTVRKNGTQVLWSRPRELETISSEYGDP